jgi:DNA-binding transcriptional regulator YiaG
MNKLPRLKPDFVQAHGDMRAQQIQEPDTDFVMHTKFGEIFQPQELDQLSKHYPKVLDKELHIRAKDPGGSGVAPQNDPMQIDSFSTYGTRGIAPLAAHEGTHEAAWKYGLPQGYNPDAVDLSIGVLREKLFEKLVSTDLHERALAKAVIDGKIKIQPGVDTIPKGYKVSDEMKNLVRAYAWSERIAPVDGDPDAVDYYFKLYKAFHGEQGAEGARMHAAGQTPKFTTPLAKQVFDRHGLQTPGYANDLQKLFEMRKTKLFDPQAEGYALPGGLAPAAGGGGLAGDPASSKGPWKAGSPPPRFFQGTQEGQKDKSMGLVQNQPEEVGKSYKFMRREEVEKIRRLKAEYNMTNKALAKRFGMSESSIKRALDPEWEFTVGGRKPTESQ